MSTCLIFGVTRKLWTRRKSRNATSPPPPDAGLVDGLPSSGVNLYPEGRKKRGLIAYCVKSLGGAIFWPLAATMLINAASLKDWTLSAVSGVGVACQAVNTMFGDPLHGIKTVIWGDKPAPALTIQPKTAEQIEAERQSEKAELVAEAEAVGLNWREDWPLEKFRVELRVFKEKKAQAAMAERQRQKDEAHRAAEEERKKPLYARADKIGLTVDPTLSSSDLAEVVAAGEAELAADAEYQALHRQWEAAMSEWTDEIENGPNGRCLTRGCGRLFHFNDARGKDQSMGKAICPKCHRGFWRVQAQEWYRPPAPPKEPLPPRKNAGLLWKILGGSTAEATKESIGGFQ